MIESFESSEVLIALDDDYFFNTILELQSLLSDGWIASEVHTDVSTDSSWVTLTRPLVKMAS